MEIDIDKERKEFEAEMRKKWGKEHFKRVQCFEGECYDSTSMNGALDGWLAAKRHAAQVAEPTDRERSDANVEALLASGTAGASVDSVARDAARLDWIEKNARYDPKMNGQHVWWATTFRNAIKGPTLREAIDAAMSPTKAGEGM